MLYAIVVIKLMSHQEQDQKLRKYVLDAQMHPQGSPARRRALNKLLTIIFASKRLRCPAGRLPPQCQGAAQEICNDAQQALMLFICQNIDRYDPSKASVIGWLNMLMDRRFIFVGIRQFQDSRERRLGKRRRLQDLMRAEEDIPAPETENPDHAELRRYITEDPEGLLQNKALQNRPEITLQLLLLQRLEDKTWDDIATKFGVSLPTLHSFFSRALKRLSPTIQAYLDPQ